MQSSCHEELPLQNSGGGGYSKASTTIPNSKGVQVLTFLGETGEPSGEKLLVGASQDENVLARQNHELNYEMLMT